MKALARVVYLFLAVFLVYFSFFWYNHLSKERALNRIIESLKGETRIAEALVTDSRKTGADQTETKIKFLEYDERGKPLRPKYFTFHGNIIQFQTLVVRFEDVYVEKRDRLRGKSIYLFLKAFALNDGKAEVFDISEAYKTPEGYKVEGVSVRFQDEIWRRFWKYVLEPSEREKLGIKNAQIEAPGSLFVPGTIYTLTIEHDGGVRIDTRPIPTILRGEKIQ
jgi:hypothetical protein